MWWIIQALSCVSPKPDCEGPGPELSQTEDTWQALLQLPLREGQLGQAGLQVMINEGDQIADCSSTGGEVLWELEGELGPTVEYGVVPEGADQLVPAAGPPAALSPGQPYTAEFWILDHYDARLSCSSWRMVWVQGQADSVVSCE